ncbi:DUF2892 domain-containing protein [Spirochaetota bacterium]
MKKNIGEEDSYIRLLLGTTFLVHIIILEPGIVGTIILALLGALFLFTSYTRSCPLYIPLKINTNDAEKQEGGTEKASEA